MAIVTTQTTVINANDDPGLNSVYNRDNQAITVSPTGNVIFVTDRAVEVNFYEQLVQQNFITSITEVNNPAGLFDGEIQFKSGNNFGANGNLIFDSALGALRIPSLSTDRLLYANGEPWVFTGSGGIAYGNQQVADFLQANPVTIITGIQSNVVTANTITAINFSYPNGSPVVSPYGDVQVARLLDTGSNAGIFIQDINLRGNVIANGYISANSYLYVKPSDPVSRQPIAGPAILPGLPFDSNASINNIYDIGSNTRQFRDIYAANSLQTMLVSAANITATDNVTANGFVGNTIILTGDVLSNNLAVANNIISSNSFFNFTTANTGIFNTALSVPNVFTVTSNSVAITVNTTVVANLTMFTGNLRLLGGANGQYLRTDGLGNLSWGNINTTSISNGTSNVTVLANSAITFGSNGVANVFTISDTGANILGNLNVNGNTVLGTVSNVTITGGSPGYVLSTNGSGGLSWVPTAGAVYYEANANSNVAIATNSQINSVLPSGAVPRTGDVFVDTNSASYNTQPVYLQVNGVWRQILTAFGGL